jgi:hypothetical protein
MLTMKTEKLMSIRNNTITTVRDKTWSTTKTAYLNETIQKVISTDALKNDENSPFFYEVRKEPLSFAGNVREDKRLLVDSDNRVLDVAGKGYGIVQPSQFVDIIENSFEGLPHNIETAMTLRDRRGLVLIVDLMDDAYEVVPGDTLRSRVMFLHSFDGVWGLSWRDTIERMFCANQIMAKIRDARFMHKTKHSSKVLDRIPNFIESLTGLLEQRQITYSAFSNLAKESVSLEQADRILAGFLNVKTTRSINKKDTILNLFKSGTENKGETLWDLFNGVTEYFTHECVGEKVENRAEKLMHTSQFGTAADRKADFLDVLTDGESIDFDSIEKLAYRGELLLREAEKRESEKATA